MLQTGRLIDLRKQRKLIQKDLAKILNVGRTTYAKYETGDIQPPNESIAKLADLFGVTTDYLLGRTDFPFDDSKPLIDNATGEELEVVRGEDGLFKIKEQKKEAPAGLTAEALQKIAEEEAGRPLTEAELVLIRTRLEDLKTTLDQITKKKD